MTAKRGANQKPYAQLAASIMLQAMVDLAGNDVLLAYDALIWLSGPEGVALADAVGLPYGDDLILKYLEVQRAAKQHTKSSASSPDGAGPQTAAVIREEISDWRIPEYHQVGRPRGMPARKRGTE